MEAVKKVRTTDDSRKSQKSVVSPGACAEVPIPITAGGSQNTARRDLDLDARHLRKLRDEQAALIALTGTFTV